jgi:hypothetical protein
MAIDRFSRWALIREIVTERKSGTLIVQLGRHYLRWALNGGTLLFVSSTNSEFWLIHHLFRKGGYLNPADVVLAETRVNENTSLGSSLMQLRKLELDPLRELVHEHWTSLSNYLLQSTARLVWNEKELVSKPHFIDLSLPFSNLLLSLERESVEIQSAVEFANDHLSRYKLENASDLGRILRGKERRLVPYLKTSASLQEILMEPDIDRFTCYRAIFLLWLSGYLQPVSKVERTAIPAPGFFLRRLRAVPPEWIFLLMLGILLGLLLAPKESPQVENQNRHQEGLEEAVPRPAWSPEPAK